VAVFKTKRNIMNKERLYFQEEDDITGDTDDTEPEE